MNVLETIKGLWLRITIPFAYTGHEEDVVCEDCMRHNSEHPRKAKGRKTEKRSDDLPKRRKTDE